MKCRIVSVFLLMSACTAGDISADPARSTQASLSVRDAGAPGSARCWTSHVAIKDERLPFMPKNDVDLIDGLVPHHQAALQMAAIEINHGTSAEVLAMAKSMREAQTREIEQLLAIRQRLTGCSTVARMRDAHHQADLALLQATQGTQLDKLFLEHMIPHHASAVQICHDALPNLKDDELRAMATNVVDMQAAEIGDMHALKTRL